MKIAHKIYSKIDQNSFADFSGDLNGVHTDEVAARRKIHGKCIVHGINAFLWAINEFIKYTNETPGHVKVNFVQPIFLDTLLEIYFCESKKVLEIKDRKETLVIIRILSNLINLPLYTEKIKSAKNLKIAKNILYKDVTEKKVEDFFIRGKPNLSKKLFPDLINKYNKLIITEIASLSQLVGMECPGEHSTFVSLSLDIKYNNETPYYQVENFDKRFGLMKIKFSGRMIFGEIRAILSNTQLKSENIDIKYLRDKVSKNEYKNVNALIIGGSRGLGRLTAKIISTGGGYCTITYNVGEKDAKNLEDEFKSNDLSCDIKHFNSAQRGIINKKFNQIYYFASPKILISRNSVLDKVQYDLYQKIYVVDFIRLCEEVIHKNINCKIFCPSTNFIDKPNEGLKSYIKAKTNLENIAKELSKKNKLSIICPRLPRFDTDQNQSILNYKYEDPVEYLIKYIRDMSKK